MPQSNTVLLVEDEQGLADLYRFWLNDQYDVVVANSGEDALEAMDDSVDVVLLDRRMPGLSGDEVLSTLRNRGYECPVAMVSAVTPKFDIVRISLDAYVRKPIEQEQLRGSVEQLLLIADCPDRQREAFAVAQKMVALEAGTTSEDRNNSPEQAQLQARLSELETELTKVIEKTGSDTISKDLVNKTDSL